MSSPHKESFVSLSRVLYGIRFLVAIFRYLVQHRRHHMMHFTAFAFCWRRICRSSSRFRLPFPSIDMFFARIICQLCEARENSVTCTRWQFWRYRHDYSTRGEQLPLHDDLSCTCRCKIKTQYAGELHRSFLWNAVVIVRFGEMRFISSDFKQPGVSFVPDVSDVYVMF